MDNLLKIYLDNKAVTPPVLNVAVSEKTATIYAHGVIYPEFGVNATDVRAAVEKAGDVDTIVFNLNTPGGSVFEGREIMDVIRNIKAKTIAHIGSLCASAGTSIAVACDETEMAEGAHYMIHNVHGGASGDKTELRMAADLFEKVEGAIVNDYVTKTGKDASEIIEMMDRETWMTATEALANGFIDRIAVGAKKTANQWNLSAYSKAPPPDLEPEKPTNEPAPVAGFFMSTANANKLRLLIV
jgi:ATP-dependent protease ClpP protease subunit